MYKITSNPIEPISLSEVKLHLRLDSNTFAGDVLTYQSILPGAHVIAESFGLLGAAVDVFGKIALANLNVGSCGAGGSIAAKIQESEDGITWSDFVLFAIVTEANDNAVQEKEYTGIMKYIRVVATVAGAACSFSADVLVKTGDTLEDDVLSRCITAARQYCENYCGQAFAAVSVECWLSQFPADAINLPYGPVATITSFERKDSAGIVTSMLATTDYLLDADSNQIVLPYGISWPSFTPYPIKPIKIVYTTAAILPTTIKQAMLLLIGHWYEHRESVVLGTISKEVEHTSKSLLDQHRVRWWS